MLISTIGLTEENFATLSSREKAGVSRLKTTATAKPGASIESVKIFRVHDKALSVFIVASRPVKSKLGRDVITILHAFVGVRGGIRIVREEER